MMKSSMWYKWLALPLLALTMMAAQAQGPDVLAKETTEQLLKALQAQKAQLDKDPSKVYGLVDQILLPHFDFRKMAQLVLGKHWRSASDAQKARFTTEFRNLLVRTYASSLVDYADQQVKFKPMRGDPGKDRRVTVSAEVQNPGSNEPLKVDSEMYLPDPNGAWKVFDVKVADVSLVTNYRSSYDTEIKKSGLDALIQNLAEDNRKANLPQLGGS